MLPRPPLPRSLAGAVIATTFAIATPTVARAQACSTADEAAGICLIQPTASQATPTASGAAGPVNVYARAVGGLSYFSGTLYAFASQPNPLNPLATQNVQLGSKGVGGLLSLVDPWVLLPWAMAGGQPLYFGLLENEVIDFAQPTVTQPIWLFSGFGTSGFARFDQIGRSSDAYSLVFGSTGPVGDQIDVNDPQSTRQPTPTQWIAANIPNPAGAGANAHTYFVGFEDSRYWSDGDFNDFVVAVNVSSVPEPSSVALLGGGLAIIGAAVRRRRR